jgi:predicted ester cyclase
MKQPDLLDRYITALRHDPTTPPPPGLDPATARAIRAMRLDDSPAIPPVGARTRIWQRILTNVQTDQSNRDASRDPRPGSWYVHSNGKHKEKKTMQTVITRPTALPRVSTSTQRIRFIRLAVAAIAVIAVAAILLPGLLNDTSPSNPAAVYLSPQAANEAIFERYINEAWNAGNTDALTDILTADHVCHEPGMPDMTGIDSMVTMIDNYRTAFPDWQFTIESITATDDEVWARLTGTGTHDGPFTLSDDVAIDATGNPVTVEVMFNARLFDGKITEQWMQSDVSGMLLETGAMPTPQQTITEARNLMTMRRALEGYYSGKGEIPLERSHNKFFMWQYGDRYFRRTQVNRDDPGGLYTEQLYNAFTDLEMTIDSMAATGDIVMAKTTFTGTLIEPIYAVWPFRNPLQIEPTGEKETWTWIFVWRFEDGRVAEEWWVWDWPRVHGE